MIGLCKGQKILFEFTAQSKLGQGTLYLLNTGITIAVKKKGLGLELLYREILHMYAEKKNALIIKWAEGIANFDLKLHVNNANEILTKLEQIRTGC